MRRHFIFVDWFKQLRFHVGNETTVIVVKSGVDLIDQYL